MASLIDHTMLRPEATRADIVKLCGEARQYGFATVCINPYWVPLAASELAGSAVKVCTVVGFPLGATSTEAKVAESAAALRAGAREIDMVINVGALRSGDFDTVKLDIQAVARVCHDAGAIVKVILETALLDDAQKTTACALAQAAGADFVKTSTGFGPAGATVQDIVLMRHAVGPRHGSEGGRRHSHAGRFPRHGGGGRQSRGRQRQREDRRGGGGGPAAKERWLPNDSRPTHARPAQSGPLPRAIRAAGFPAGSVDSYLPDAGSGRTAGQRLGDRQARDPRRAVRHPAV